MLQRKGEKTSEFSKDVTLCSEKQRRNFWKKWKEESFSWVRICLPRQPRTALDTTKFGQFMKGCTVWGLETTCWYHSIMILHAVCWGSSKIMLKKSNVHADKKIKFWPNTFLEKMNNNSPINPFLDRLLSCLWRYPLQDYGPCSISSGRMLWTPLDFSLTRDTCKYL